MENENLTIKQQREVKRQEKMQRREERDQKEPKKRMALWLGVIILVIAVIVGMVLIVKNTKGTETSGSANVLDSITSSDWIDGNKNASTTLTEYGDFQCPACGAYYPLVKEIKSEFKDKVRFVFRHFPLPQHPNAIPAALAAEAAGAQEKFFEMHDMLYENQDAWADKPNPQDIFVAYAQKLGLNIDQFKKDVQSTDLLAKINASEDQGVKFGVDSTPTFYLGNTKIEPRTLAEFKQIITDAITPKP